MSMKMRIYLLVRCWRLYCRLLCVFGFSVFVIVLCLELIENALPRKQESLFKIIRKSWNMTDYLDLTDPDTFLAQPQLYFYGPQIQILIMVTSSPDHFLARSAIRQTWGSLENTRNKSVRLAFVLGRRENASEQELVQREQRKFHDILQENFYDSYSQLSIKTMAILKWINLTCNIRDNETSSPVWIFKTDDDMFINVDRLVEVTREHMDAQLIGYLACGAAPDRNVSSKYYMSEHLYPGKVYPGFLSGTGYLFRSYIVPSLLEKALVTPLLHLEDIYFALLTSRLGYVPVDSPFFSYFSLNIKNRCALRVMVSSHNVNPERMKVLWSKLNDNTTQIPPRCNPKIQRYLIRSIPRIRMKKCLFLGYSKEQRQLKPRKRNQLSNATGYFSPRRYGEKTKRSRRSRRRGSVNK